MSKIFFIADLHFDDPRVIKYELRPFGSIEEMNQAIIGNWNTTVSEEDDVYILGDVSAQPIEYAAHHIQQLKGRKHLILGNHDAEDLAGWMSAGFESVSKHPIVLDSFWILSHKPMYVTESAPYANIFGHIHHNPMYRTVSCRSYCVSAERTNYTPIDFETIKSAVALADELKNNS